MAKSFPIICKTVKHGNLYDMFYYYYGKIIDSKYNMDYWTMKYHRSNWQYNAKTVYKYPEINLKRLGV